MKVIVSLTSIPSRFDKLPTVLAHLCQQACHEVWINIPKTYNRFPDWDGQIPNLSIDPKIKVNSDCEDVGPGTKFIAPAMHLEPDDIIVYLDDDTSYDPRLVMNLLKWHRVDTQSAWGLSGFTFENYFERRYPRQHGVKLDVLEGYGGVLVKAEWIQKLTEEFKELTHEARFADDIVISNLLEKQNIKRRTVFTEECNVGHIKQYQYGFDSDALHHQVQGDHHENYRLVLNNLEYKEKLYYKHKCW
jgi:hypothetical protein